MRRQVVDGALDRLDGRGVDRVLLGQGQRRVEGLVRARAGRVALDADAGVDDLVRRAEPGGDEVPGRDAARAVRGAEAIAVLERARVPGEAGLREQRGLDPAPARRDPRASGLQSVPKFALIPLAMDAAMASACAVRSAERPSSLAAAAAAPKTPRVDVACQPVS